MNASTPTRRWAATIATLSDPLQWFEPHRIHLDADLFDGSVSLKDIARVYAVMQLSQHHTFLVLTKHSDAMLSFYDWIQNTEEGRAAWLAEVVGAPAGKNESWSEAWPFRNIWLGVSVKDQAEADARLPMLLQCPAVVRWIRAELVGPVDLTDLACGENALSTLDVVGGIDFNDPDAGIFPVEREHPSRISWVVVAGQVGPDARPLHPGWVDSIHRQCRDAKVAFNFETWGEWCPRSSGYAIRDDVPRVRLTICGCNGQSDLPVGPVPGGETLHDCSGRYDVWVNRVGVALAGRELDGKVWDGYPKAVTP